MTIYDIIVAGGGPSGASAAWQAAREGARVLVIDKAVFPRDKPCGDGLTPRATKLLEDMGVGNELKRFRLVDRLRITVGNRVREYSWPAREGLPNHGYVVARTDLDDILLREAESVGAEVREGTQVIGPLVEDDVVRGVRVRSGGIEEKVFGRVVIAADGAASVMGRALGMVPLPDRPTSLAVRAQIDAAAPDSNALGVYFLRVGKSYLPGYGWVFPMGDGRLNIGIGILATYPTWKDVNVMRLMNAFVDILPEEWSLPSVEEMRNSGALKAWKLPMGLAVWPPWNPGVLAVGDAAGVVKPPTGAGISKALESGRIGAAVTLEALDSGKGPEDLSAYATRLEERWGPFYKTGRRYVDIAGKPWALRLVLSRFGIPLAARKMVRQSEE